MANLRDQFADDKDLSHLTPSAKPAPQPASGSKTPAPANQSLPQLPERSGPTPEPTPDSPAPDDAQTSGASLPSIGGRERPGSQGRALTNRNASSQTHRGSANHHHLPQAANKGTLRGNVKKQLARRGIMAGLIAVGAEGIIVLLVVVVLFAAALSFVPGGTGDAFACTTDSVGTIEIPPPGADGYSSLPDDAAYNRSSPPEQQRGLPQLVKTLLIVSRQWNQSHPTPKLVIGDLNAPGHLSHKDGRDVDITSTGGIMMTEPGYDRRLAVELGKLFVDQGNLELILYNDTSVQQEVNDYARSKGLSGTMQFWANHENHFHVRITGSEPRGGGSVGDGAECSGVASGVLSNGYSESQLRTLFGDPTPSLMEKNLVAVDFLGQAVKVHKRVAPSLRAVSDEIKLRGIAYRPEASKGGMGCYRYDSDNGDSNIGTRSYHTYGAACDINPGTNNYFSRPTAKPYNANCPISSSYINGGSCYDMPPEYVQIFAKHGFSWGGKWKSKKDYMHFEWNGVKP